MSENEREIESALDEIEKEIESVESETKIYTGSAPDEIKSFVNRLFADIPDSARKYETKQEIIQNLSEKVADLTANGMTEGEAVQKAIDDFGDIGDLGAELADSARGDRVKKAGLTLAYSVWGGLLLTSLFVFINLYYTPRVIWCVYPAFAVAWWPLTMFFIWLKRKTGRSTGFAYSACGFALISGLMLFMNLYLTPRVVWCVYPIFAAAWWPLSMLFYGLRKNNRQEGRYDD